MRETIGLLRRTLARLDVSSRTLFALIEPGSCFAGTLLELALAADRSYMLDVPDEPTRRPASPSRAQLRLLPDGQRPDRACRRRFYGDAGAASTRCAPTLGSRSTPTQALALGLVTVAPDDIDWDDEVRLALEERASFSPDALTGMEANLRFAGPETMETQDLRPPVRLAELDLPAAQRRRRARARSRSTARASRPQFDWNRDLNRSRSHERIDYSEKIPNNVNLGERPHAAARARAVAAELPRLVERDGPGAASQSDDVYLRTAITVDAEGWAHFDYVKMPDYRWGIFLADPASRTARSASATTWASRRGRRCPASTAPTLRRLIVTQGDTEPASVEQQRHLGLTAPVALRPAQPVPGQRRGGPPPVGDGLPAAHATSAATAARRPRRCSSAAPATRDKPRILGAFNEPTPTGCRFFMFTYFTDRDGKYQLCALAESGFDPLARTSQFMLTEEAHHMFVGETGVGRVVQRTLRADEAAGQRRPGDDPRRTARSTCRRIQRYLNFWYSVSLDLFGAEISSNARPTSRPASRAGPDESQYEDHVLRDSHFPSCSRPKGSRTSRC